MLIIPRYKIGTKDHNHGDKGHDVKEFHALRREHPFGSLMQAWYIDIVNKQPRVPPNHLASAVWIYLGNGVLAEGWDHES